MALTRRQIVFSAALLALTGSFFVAAVFAGHAIVVSKHVYYNSLLFGVDTLRFMEIFTEPGIHNQADLERSNVHPLFSIMIKPWAPLVQKLGLTKGVSAVVVNAAGGAIALLLAAWFFIRRKMDLIEAWLLTLLMGASATWVCMSAIPASYIFSLSLIILSFIMTDWTLKHPDGELTAMARWGRETLWLAAGLINYGITVSNGMISFLAYGFGRRGRRGWVRAVVYGALVLGLGMALSKLMGSSLNMVAERQWYVNDALRGGTPRYMNLITLETPTLWSFVVPWPTFHGLADQGKIYQIAGILNWNFKGVDWLLLGIWTALLTTALIAALADRDAVGRRLSAALAAALAFHVVMHRFYFHAYEGVFFFTPHSLFMTIGLCAPLALKIKDWPAGAKWGARIFLFLFALALAIRNYHYFYALLKIIPIPS